MKHLTKKWLMLLFIDEVILEISPIIFERTFNAS